MPCMLPLTMAKFVQGSSTGSGHVSLVNATDCIDTFTLILTSELRTSEQLVDLLCSHGVRATPSKRTTHTTTMNNLRVSQGSPG